MNKLTPEQIQLALSGQPTERVEPTELASVSPLVIEIGSETPDQWRDRTGSYEWVNESATTYEGRYGRAVQAAQDLIHETLVESTKKLIDAAHGGQAWAIKEHLNRGLGLPVSRVQIQELPTAPQITESQRQLVAELERLKIEHDKRQRLALPGQSDILGRGEGSQTGSSDTGDDPV